MSGRCARRRSAAGGTCAHGNSRGRRCPPARRGWGRRCRPGRARRGSARHLRRAPAPEGRSPPAPGRAGSRHAGRRRSPAGRGSAGWPGRPHPRAPDRRPASRAGRSVRSQRHSGPHSRKRSAGGVGAPASPANAESARGASRGSAGRSDPPPPPAPLPAPASAARHPTSVVRRQRPHATLICENLPWKPPGSAESFKSLDSTRGALLFQETP